MTDLLTRVHSIADEIIKIRRDLHEFPEVAFEEYRTAEYVGRYLENLGLELKKGVARTGVIGLLRGGRPGKTIALRAELDAVPGKQAPELPDPSGTPRANHSCGHDAHMAMALGAAKILTSMRDRISGNVKFLFEPAEEKVSFSEEDPVGSVLFIREGCLVDPPVEKIIALHVQPTIPAGRIVVPRETVLSGWDIVDLQILGKESHASFPEQGVDAIAVAGLVIAGVQTYMSRMVKLTTPCAFHIGEIHGGSQSLSRSVLADRVEMRCSIRCADLALRRKVAADLEQVVGGIAKAYGAAHKFVYTDFLRPVKNDPQSASRFIQAASRYLGGENIHLVDEPTMGGEPFYHYSEAVPSVFAWLGSGSDEARSWLPLHHPAFNLDERCLSVGVTAFCAYVLDELSKND